MNTEFKLSIMSVFLFTLLNLMVGCKDGKKNVAVDYEPSVNKSNETESTIIDSSLYGPHDVYIPPHDPELDKRIKKVVSDLVDTNEIWRIHQYADHYKVRFFNNLKPSTTGYVLLSKDLSQKKMMNLNDLNPFEYDIVSNATNFGIPVYNLEGWSREKVEKNIDDVIWDNAGDPIHMYIESTSSNFAPTNMVRGYIRRIVGTEGSMAVKSTLYIENNKGKFLDSIELIGSEIWSPAITDDGKYLAYFYGRAYPEEGGGEVTQHFTIYDIEKKEHIYELRNFTTYGNGIGATGNFVIFSKYAPKDKYKSIRYYMYPRSQKIYVVPTSKMEGEPWGRFSEVGIFNLNKPNAIISTWDEFDMITFEEYKKIHLQSIKH